MTRLQALIVLIVVSAGQNAVGQERARLRSEEIRDPTATAFSGPGRGYYPTAVLPIGTRVTIFGEPLGEWAAILPPRKSFSWIQASSVREDTDGSGVVVAEKAKVWVGSSLTDAHNVMQCELKRGDRVDILDVTTFSNETGRERYYKILPPEDELRYVPLASLQGNRWANSAPAPDRRQENLPATPGVDRLNSQRTIPSAPARGLTEVRVSQRMAEPASAIAAVANKSVDEPPTRILLPAGSFDERLRSARLQLKQMRSRRPDFWDVGSAEAAFQKLYGEAPDVQTSAVLVDLDQIRRMQILQDQYVTASRRRIQALEKDRELESRAISQGSNLATPFAADGVLKNSSRKIDGRKSYSLLGRDGRETHAVVPAPGILLDRHVGTRVGFHGAIQSKKGVFVPVVIAEQLAPLDDWPLDDMQR